MSPDYLDCIQCGRSFELSAFEKRRFAAKGFEDPLRCPDCRKHKSRVGESYPIYRHRKRDYRLKYGAE